MAKKIVTMNCVDFEFQNKLISDERIDIDFRWSKGDIFTAYKTPSQAKIEEWDRWVDFFIEMGAFRMAVGSRNSFTFTVIAETEDYYFYITAKHNRVWLKESSDLEISEV